MSSLIVKIVLWIVAIAFAIFAASKFVLDRPASFVFNQATNHFHYKGKGAAKTLSTWLIDTGIAQDWSIKPEQHKLATISYPLLLSAANPTTAFPYQTYGSENEPRELQARPFVPPALTKVLEVSTVGEMTTALKKARPGDIITFAPGTYDISTRSIPIRAAGTASLPIYLRAERFGSVFLQMNTLEGFHVMAPFWVFENLSIRGVCTRDSDCEHAFHVVGDGHSFTLRNSELVNFNAPIKVNLQRVNGANHYPDYGLIEYSSFYNERRRATDNPVTLLNINSVDGWVVRGNYIADFAKGAGDHTSYGAFMKGNGLGGIFERNLVMCEHRLAPDEGIRIGLSFGGGGTGDKFCKHGSCATEHVKGIMRNNIIINCSRDVGIYLNRAHTSQIHHNLLYNTLGIDVRFSSSTASISNNIVSGRIKNRDGGKSTATDNIIARDCIGSSRAHCELEKLYQAPDGADFRLKAVDNPIWQPLRSAPQIDEDFCGTALPQEPNIGPIQYRNGMDCLSPGLSAKPG